MTLKEIWRTMKDRRYVAFRPGQTYYLPLGYKLLDDAIEGAAAEQGIDTAALQAGDWEVGEIVPHDCRLTEEERAAGKPQDPRHGLVKGFKLVS